MSIESVITELSTLVNDLTGIKHVYEKTPEAIGVYPCARIFPAEGELLSGPAWTEDVHTLVVEVRVARGHLPASEELYRPYIVAVGTMLQENPNISSSCQTIIPPVTYRCGYLDAIGKNRTNEVDVGIIFEIKVKETAR